MDLSGADLNSFAASWDEPPAKMTLEKLQSLAAPHPRHHAEAVGHTPPVAWQDPRAPPPGNIAGKKHKKKRRRDDGGADTSCIAARALAGGFVRESGLLPPEAAAAAADLVRQAPEEAWRRSSAKADAKAHGKKTNTTRHSYAVGDGGVDAPDADVEALIQSVLESVAPSEWLRARRLVPRLQLGRYGRGDHIVKHDDAAVVEIDGVPHERRIALVYYLTGEPTWDASLGGLFVDHATGRRLAPVHNTLVAFRVRAVWKSTSELD